MIFTPILIESIRVLITPDRAPSVPIDPVNVELVGIAGEKPGIMSTWTNFPGAASEASDTARVASAICCAMSNGLAGGGGGTRETPNSNFCAG